MVINNRVWQNDPKEKRTREGSEHDVSAFKSVADYLKYEVMVKENLTAEEMKAAMMEAADKVTEDHDSFICCVMSHGNDMGIEGVDHEECHDSNCKHDNEECMNYKGIVTATELACLVNPKKCKNLAHKPKIFIIQACRGDRVQEPAQFDGGWLPWRPKPSPPAKPIPPTADYFFAYSTAPETKAVVPSISRSFVEYSNNTLVS